MLSRYERTAGTISLCLLCAGVFSLTLPGLIRRGRPDAADPVSELIDYVSHSAQRFAAPDRSRSLQPRDPVFLQRGGLVVQVGYIERIQRAGGQPWAHVRWYDHSTNPESCRLVAYHNRGRLEDAIELMLPHEKRRRIEQLLAVGMKQHGQRIASRLGPIVERSIRDSLPAIEHGLRSSMARHRPELDQLAVRWNDEIIEQQLVPLAKQEIVPIVRRHGEPVAREIGRELWERASIWSFTWRALYDKTPLPRKDLMKQEWERFVEQEAIPVLESHANEIATAVQRTIVDAAESPRVREELAAAADVIARDPQARAVLQTLLREAVIENPTLRKVWTDIWTSDEVRIVLEEEGRRLEPLVRQIGDELMGTREQGIDPGFARLLRNQVLQKDQRWLMATLGTDPTRPRVIEVASERSVFPMPMFAAELP